MRQILVVVAALLSSFPVRAETPARYCGEWWQVASDVPLHIEEVPNRPNIFLPVRKPWGTWGGWGETPVVVTTLTVEVTGARGHRPSGELDILLNYAGGQTWLEGTVRWRALEDLVVGERYTIEVVVPDSPLTWFGSDCPSQPGFVQKVTFDVVDSPPESPAIDMSVGVLGAWEPDAYYGHCREGLDDLRCANLPEICCWLWGFWHTKATVAVSGLMPPPIYTLLEVNFERHDSIWGDERDTRWFAAPPLVEPMNVASSQIGEGRPPDDVLCVRASVHSLLRDASFGPIATVRVCPDFSGFQMPEAPTLDACRPERCADYGYLSEPGPEVVEVVDEVEVADPAWDSSPSGCGGATASILGVALSVWFVGRRREVSLRSSK